ncbi:MAG: hypothetical protein QOE70_230 [Chthoniobacter sp.]|jgi:uncharacterized protein YigE (DUF2233 family)|nr:hypothetical protein [Chthoniobacter sp.]
MKPSSRLMKPFLLALALSPLWKAAAVEYRKAEFAGKSFTVCRVNVRKEHLELFLRDEKGVPIKRFDKLAAWLQPRGQKLLFAMNAGMYNPDFSAEGLFVNAGLESVPLNTGKGYGNFFLRPNGAFVVTERGARVVETTEYLNLRERVILATQSGPLLVHHGVLHPAFIKDSTSRLFRNGVGVPSPDIALFVITEAPVNFYEFATLFRDQLKCPDALFLDGTISSLYAPQLKRFDFRMDLGPIIGVTE